MVVRNVLFFRTGVVTSNLTWLSASERLVGGAVCGPQKLSLAVEGLVRVDDVCLFS